LLSRQEAKNRIKKFIDEQDYTTVKGIADQLNAPISFSERSISKSLRVSFLDYVKLVKQALKGKTDLSTIMRNTIVKDLEELIANINQRREIAPHRLNLFRQAFETWKSELSETESSPQSSYSPSMFHYPVMKKKLVKPIIQQAIGQIKQRCSSIPPRVLERRLKVDWETSIDDVYDDYTAFLDIEIQLSQNGQVMLKVELATFLRLNMDFKEYVIFSKEVENQYGVEASQTLKKVLDVDKEWAEEIGMLPIFFKVDILSVPIEIKGKTLSMGNISAEYEGRAKKVKPQFEKPEDTQLAVLKSEIDKARKQEDWNAVSAVSEKLSQLETHNQLREYGFDLASALAKKTQVLSFRAPEMIIRAWEAHGEIEAHLLEA